MAELLERGIKQDTKSYALRGFNRLHRRRDYLRFFSTNTVFRLSECTIFRIPNDKGVARLGLTFKARGTSVQRNKVKRIIREAMRKTFPSAGSNDFNVVVPANKKLTKDFRKQLFYCLNHEFQEKISSHKGN